MNIDYKLIGSRIKAERNKQGITQEVMAERLDVTVGYVSQVERGITKISLDLLGKISAILGCDIASLITNSAPGEDKYMLNDIMSEVRRLRARDKKIILSIIKMMNEET